MQSLQQFFYIWFDKEDTVQMSGYFPKPKSSGGRVKVKLDLSNYAKKNKKIANFKSDVDKLDIDKLKNIQLI